MRRLLVLRPEPQASVLVADLVARGFDAVAAPMLDVIGAADPVARVRAADAGAEALILTSPQAARLIGADPEQAQLAGLPVFAVGPATAEAARAAGFVDVVDAGGAADALVATVSRSRFRRLVHAAGRDRVGDVAGRLGAAGIAVAVAEIYRAEPVRRLDAAVADGLERGAFAGLVVASTRTAAAFATVLASNGGLDRLRELVLFAISETAAAPLGPHCRRTVLASRPNGAALLDAVTREAGEGEPMP